MKKTSLMTRITAMMLAIMMMFTIVAPNMVFAGEEVVGQFKEPADWFGNKWNGWVNVNVKEKNGDVEKPIEGAKVTIRLDAAFYDDETYTCFTDKEGKAVFNVLQRWDSVKNCKVEYKGIVETQAKKIIQVGPHKRRSADYEFTFQTDYTVETKSVCEDEELEASESTTVKFGNKFIKEASEIEGYEFKCWNYEDGEKITDNKKLELVIEENVNVIAKYEAKKFNITNKFVCDENEIAKEIKNSLKLNEENNCSASEIISNDAGYEYKFINWTKDDKEVTTDLELNVKATEDAIYVANYELVKQPVKVVFINEETEKEIDFDNKIIDLENSSVLEEINKLLENEYNIGKIIKLGDKNYTIRRNKKIAANDGTVQLLIYCAEKAEAVTLKHVVEFTDSYKNAKKKNYSIEIDEESVDKEKNQNEYINKYAKEGYIAPSVSIDKKGDAKINYYGKLILVQYKANGRVIKEGAKLVPWQEIGNFKELDASAFDDYITALDENESLTVDGKVYRKENVNVIFRGNGKEGSEVADVIPGNRTFNVAEVTVNMKQQVRVNHYLYFDKETGDKLIKSEVVDKKNDVKDYLLNDHRLFTQGIFTSKNIKVTENEVNIYYWAKRVNAKYVLKDLAGNEKVVKQTKEIYNFKEIPVKDNATIADYAKFVDTSDITDDGKIFVFNNAEISFETVAFGTELNQVNIKLVFNEYVAPKDLKVNHYLRYNSKNEFIKTTEGYMASINENAGTLEEKYASFILEGYVLDSLYSASLMNVTNNGELNLYYWAKEIKVNYTLDEKVIKTTVTYYPFDFESFTTNVNDYEGKYEKEITISGVKYTGEVTSVKVIQTGTSDPKNKGGKKINTGVEITVELEKDYGHNHRFRYTSDGIETHTGRCVVSDTCDKEITERHEFEDGQCVKCGELQEIPLFLGRYLYSAFDENKFIERANTELVEKIEDENPDEDIAITNYDNLIWELVRTEGSIYTYQAEVIADHKYKATIEFQVEKRKSGKKKKKQNEEIINDDETPLAFTALDRENDFITRAEFTELVSKLFIPEDKGQGKEYTDINENQYKDVIDNMTKYGLTCGYDDETFGPNDFITNEQIMNILVRGLLVKNKCTKLTKEEVIAELSKAIDGKDVSEWAKELSAVAVKLELFDITEEGKLNPLANKTRGDINTLFRKFISFLAK